MNNNEFVCDDFIVAIFLICCECQVVRLPHQAKKR